MNQPRPWSDGLVPDGGGHGSIPDDGPPRTFAGRGVALSNRGLIIALAAAVLVLLVALGTVIFVALGGFGNKSLTAKGIVQDHAGNMYDPNDLGLEDLIGTSDSGMQCSGSGIDDRSVLTIADASGKVLATGGLTFEPDMSSEGDDGMFGSLSAYCIFSFEVPNVESDAEYFQLTISGMPGGMPPIDRQTLIDGAEISISSGR